MPTPYLINANILEASQPFINQYEGPIRFGGAIYVIVHNVSSVGFPVSPIKIAVFKSTNEGVTWAEQDPTANDALPVNEFFGAAGAYYPGSGNIIYFAYVTDADPQIRLINFNMSTNLYEGLITGGPSPAIGPSGTPIRIAKLSNGNIFVAYCKSPSSDLKVYCNTYNGSWGTEQLVSTESGTFSTLRDIVIDNSDRIHILREKTNASPNEVFYSNWFEGILSTPEVVISGFTGGANNQFTPIGPGRYDASTDEVKWPYGKYNSSTNANFLKVAVLRGTPSNNPVFTQETAYDDPVSGSQHAAWAMTTGPRDIIFFATNDFGISKLEYIEKISGVWSAPTLYWDLYAQPPTPPPPIYDIEYSSMTLRSNGSFDVMVGMFDANSTELFCDVQFFLSNPVISTGGWKVYEI